MLLRLRELALLRGCDEVGPAEGRGHGARRSGVKEVQRDRCALLLQARGAGDVGVDEEVVGLGADGRLPDQGGPEGQLRDGEDGVPHWKGFHGRRRG